MVNIWFLGLVEITASGTTNKYSFATPRGLIAFLENNYQEDGSIKIPKALQPYMGGKQVLK